MIGIIQFRKVFKLKFALGTKKLGDINYLFK